MYLADYHTHSRVSPDAASSMVDMAQAALDAGLQEICFTDHIEPFYNDGTDRDPKDWDALRNEFADVQAVMGDKIQLRLGMELGEAPVNLPLCDQMLAMAPNLDFVIGSIHCLSKAFNYIDLYDFRPQSEEHAYRAIEDYLGVVQAQCNWGKFTVLGHLTLPLRYFNEQQGMHMSFDPFEEQVAEIFRTIVDKGLGIEVNTNRNHVPLPHDKWLKLYRQLGGQRITLGSDAHKPSQVALGIRECQALLKECGFQDFCTFDQGREIWHRL